MQAEGSLCVIRSTLEWGADVRWILSLFRKPRAGEYRVVRRLGGFEPQCSYTAGMVDGIFWYPLNPDGFWLEPDAFSYGNVTKHISLPKDDANRAILRARALNEQHIRAARS